MAPRVAYVYRGEGTPFIHRDIRILGDSYDVEAVDYGGFPSLGRVFRAVRAADAALGWWADHHTAAMVTAGRLSGTPTGVIVGGYDTADVPEFGYGMRASGSRLQLASVRWALSRADVVLPVSRYALQNAREMADLQEAVVVPNGVDVDRFRPPEDGSPRDQVLTVGSLKAESIRRKGVDRFLEVARRFPDTRFVVAGSLRDEAARTLADDPPDGVDFLGFVPDDELDELYRRAGAYLQLSLHEAFGISVAESMASGCIPVVSDRAALPEVVGDAGHVVPYGDTDAAAEAVREALDAGEEARARARQRVVDAYRLERRREGLEAVVKDLVRGREHPRGEPHA